MPLKQKFPELTFIGKKRIAFLSGPCQQGRGLNVTTSVSAVQMSSRGGPEQLCPAPAPASLGEWCELPPRVVLLSEWC